MRFFAIASLVFAAAASVLASPVVKRENTRTLQVTLSDLQTAISTPVQGLYKLVAADNVTEESVITLIDEISAAFTTAIEAVEQITAGDTSLDDILGLVTTILKDVLSVVSTVLTVGIPAVVPILTTVVGLTGNFVTTLAPLVVGLAGALVPVLLPLLAPLAILDVAAAFSPVIGV